MNIRLLALIAVLLAVVPATGVAAQSVFASADVSADLRPSYDDDLYVQVSNDGPADTAAVIDVDVPEGITVVRLPAGCEWTSDTRIRCSTEEMIPGTRTTFPLEVIQTIRGPQRWSATVTSQVRDPRSANDRAIVDLDTLPTPTAHADPVADAVSVSRLRFPEGTFAGEAKVPFVVLARDDAFADSLAGTALTGRAPLLYTPTAALAEPTAQEIDRLLPNGGTVYVLGGTAAVGEDVTTALRDRGHQPVRLAGDSRITTALAIADQVVALGGSAKSVIVARAYGEGTAAWADSVAVGGFAASTMTPVVLSPTEALPTVVAGWLAARSTSTSIVAGGTSALGAAVEASLPGPDRVAGADRAATAAAIAARLPLDRDAGHGGYHLVNGFRDDGWTHGLVVAGLVSDEGAPLLFVDTAQAPAATEAMLTSCRDNPIPIAAVGGEGAISEDLRSELDELDASACE